VNKVAPVVLCGGAGSRLWPASRSESPKPLLALGVGGSTLLASTLERLTAPMFTPPRLVCGRAHLAAVAAHAPGVACLVEPMPKGTAAAVLAAACDAKEGLVLVLPADHTVSDWSAMAAAMEAGIPAANDGRVVLFGVAPDRPATGFGWIELGDRLGSAVHVRRFCEKPSQSEAEALLARGGHVWNSGMFLFDAQALLAEARSLEPDLVDAVERAVSGSTQVDGHRYLAEGAFAEARAVPFDIAIMERKRAAVVPVDMGWDDVGTWEAVWRLGKKDADGNVRSGKVRLEGCEGSLVWSDGPQVVAACLRDMAVVASSNGVLVVPRSMAQSVGTLAAQSDLSELRPWGSYAVVDRGAGFQVKRLTVEPGHRLSEQSHGHRSERWTVVAGQADVHLDGRSLTLAVGESVHIPLGMTHRLGNSGPVPLVVVEVQTGTYLEEDDIQRGADDYGRA
jgi:mannose-1-phosphate guanylyltransferase / mannose-6-phosphate isomerase